MSYVAQPRGTTVWSNGVVQWSTKTTVLVPFNIRDDQRVGQKTPGWDKPRREGSLVMNPYSRSSQISRSPPPYCLHVSDTTTGGVREHIETYFSYAEALQYFAASEVESKPSERAVINTETLKRKALERSNEEDWNVAVMIAEGHETLAMLAQSYKLAKNPTRSLTDAFCRLVKKNPRLSVHKASLSQVFGTGSSAWLTYQLGIYPLIKDIESGYEFVRKRYKLEYRASVRPQASASIYTDTSYVSPHGGGSGLPPGSSILTQRTFLQQRDVATITSDYKFKNYTDLFTEKLGTRFSQTPLLIWEKIPFSFLVDYLVDVGGWLTQVREPVGLTARAACYSSKRVTSSILELHAMTWKSYGGGVTWNQYLSWAGGTSAASGFSFDREPYDCRSAPYHPTWGEALDVVKSANVASLAYLACQRKLRTLRVN